jgi:hypothetical protein
MDLLWRETEIAGQDKESMRLGHWILPFAIVAALCAAVSLFVDMPYSKLLHSMSSEASPASAPQTMPSDVLTKPPPAKEPVLAKPLKSPTPESTSTPTETPIKFPPPAP